MVKSPPVAALIIAVALAVTPAYAEEPETAPGQAYSTSFAALTPGSAIAIRPLDNTRANMTLSQHFAAALRKRALAVRDMPAPLVLNFATEIDQAIRRDVPVPSAAGSSDGTQRGRLAIEIDRGMLRYVLTATLDDERTGQRVWQGEAIYSGAPADEAMMLAAMAGILGEQVGQTVRPRSFRLE